MQDTRIKAIVIGLTGVISAILIGSWLPGSSYLSVLVASTVVVAAIYSLFLSYYVFFFAFLAIAFDVTMQPFGFGMGTSEIIGALFGPLFLINIWRKDSESFNLVEHSARNFRAIFFTIATYTAIHLWYNRSNPYYAAGFSVSNAAKVYYAMLIPFFIIAWFSIKPPVVHVPKHPLQFISIILLVGLIFNICVKAYGAFVLGIYSSNPDLGADIPISALNIPFVNLAESKFALRMLAPFVTLIATLALTARTDGRCPQRPLYLLLLFLGVLGAALSMGRASLMFALALPAAIMVWRRRTATLFVFAAFGVLTLVSIRIVHEISPESVPLSIRRTVALIPGMGMESDRGSIEGSSDWRERLFRMALEEWQSKARVFWFGRSTSSVTGQDIAAYANPSFRDETIFIMSLRRGATHNLITDLLINVGLIGFCLYILLWVSTIVFLFRLARQSKPEGDTRQLFMGAAIFSLFFLLYSIIGGGWMPSSVALLACMGFLTLKNDLRQPPIGPHT